MIESIEIKNFRCFKDTKIAKFGLVNLFGGLNNSGKTTLLEAIHLVKNPYNEIVRGLQTQVRSESELFIKAKPENAWDNFFYQQNKQNDIQIHITDNKTENREVLLTCDENITDLINFTQNADVETSEFFDKLSISKKSALHTNGKDKGVELFSSVLVATHAGVAGKSKQSMIIKQSSFLLLPTQKISLSIVYEQLRFNEKDGLVLNAVQIIDNTIEKIEVFNIGEPIMYLTQKDRGRFPISLFGDAINTVVKFVIIILSNPDSSILIDEIENGIHYTVQEKLWEMLFKLAIEFNVQIFSTSHSLEMIKAFAKVAQQFPERAAYFEMARSQKTGLIKGIKHDVNTLLFELDRNIAIRGE
jgi:AAA15 family ATPase/GTPase